MVVNHSNKTRCSMRRWRGIGFLFFMCLSFVGCSTLGLDELEQPPSEESIVLGFVQVEASGPFFRMHQDEARVRFFDVRHADTGDWIRVDVKEQAGRFVAKLLPGYYELFRIQIGEGPFRSESLVEMSFEVVAHETNYLGLWRLRVDPPKTVRMLQWEVLAETEHVDPARVLHSILGENPLAVSLLKPETSQNRLFAVAPSQPRSKYFYRR